jgi:Sulfotransferase family
MKSMVASIEGQASPVSCADPVFVLCSGRSGSTLLRFLLDAHPELACPPETNLPALCAQLATVWSLIEGAALSANRGDEPPVIPETAIAGIRATMDSIVGPYLARRGKTRYCDKSLGTARFTGLLARVYPQARFLCLYRHPMDVIASGIEACPWGLSGYGFDPYMATSPGNAVLALARFWTDNTAATLAAEEQFADRCLRVRYEDLATDPEGTAARVFSFLQAAPAPGISEACFSAQRERHGPGDHKIWYTSKVSADSIGRGWSIPAAMIAAPVLDGINELAGKLDYLAVDNEWGTSEPPADLRVAATGEDAAVEAEPGHLAVARADLGGPAAALPANPPACSELLRARLEASLDEVTPQTAGRWQPHETETMVAIWIPGNPDTPGEHWLVDLRARTVTFASRAAQEKSDWDVIGSGDAWEQVIAGKVNLSVALRACQLRYCDGSDYDPVTADERIAILADLLALTRW